MFAGVSFCFLVLIFILNNLQVVFIVNINDNDSIKGLYGQKVAVILALVADQIFLEFVEIIAKIITPH